MSTTRDAIAGLAAGNPGALTVAMAVVQHEGVAGLTVLASLGLRGEALWDRFKLYQALFGGDAEGFAHYLVNPAPEQPPAGPSSHPDPSTEIR